MVFWIIRRDERCHMITKFMLRLKNGNRQQRNICRLFTNNILRSAHLQPLYIATSQPIFRQQCCFYSYRREKLPFWEEGFDALKAYIKEYGNALVPRDYETEDGVRLGAWIYRQREDYASEPRNINPVRIQRLNNIGLFWELNYDWLERYKELKQYRQEHGDALVPQIYKQNPSLGIWVVNQRTAYKEGSLSDERIRKLEEMGFVWDPLEDQWSERFEELVQYVKEHGNALVPNRYKENPSFGAWVVRQRTAYKEGSLSDERIRKLEDVDFVWDPLEAQWLERFEELNQYVKEHGDALVPHRYKENRSLGRWVSKQRHAYKEGSLSDERIQKLEEVGFVWDPLEDQWLEHFEELVQYVKEHVNSLVPRGYKTLGIWVQTQRDAYKAGSLSDERIQKLEVVGFVWDPFEDQWLERFEELVQYVKEHGNALVPREYKDNLGQWVSTQRTAYKTGSLSDERIQKLEDVDFVWDPFEAQWLERFEELNQYVKEHDDALVPDRYKENRSLGRWVSKQRQAYKEGSLSDGRIRKLEGKGFVWVVKC